MGFSGALEGKMASLISPKSLSSSVESQKSKVTPIVQPKNEEIQKEGGEA
jgi:hypothetical protein